MTDSVNLTVNLIFTVIFAGFAWNSLRRGWRFFTIGWTAFRANGHKSHNEMSIDDLQDVQFGSNFLIAGLAWLSGGLISVILCLMFLVFAITGTGIFNFIP